MSAAVLLVAGSALGANRLPQAFSQSTVIAGLENPTAVAFAPNGRIFIAEKGGIIRVFDGPRDRSGAVFADLRLQVHDFIERGLLGLALHPEFRRKPFVYALYTHDAPIGGKAPAWGGAGPGSDDCPEPPGAYEDGCVVSGRLMRLKASGSRAVKRKVLVEDWCQQYTSHSVGDLAFNGPGVLYVSGGEGAAFHFDDYGQEGSPPNPCGDPPAGAGGTQSPPTAEGGSLRSQDLRTGGDPAGLNGSVIRINPVTGDALASNPLSGSSDPNERRIVGYGFRNPYRIAVRPGTDEVWVGDVGSSLVEEIDVLRPGVVPNHGWPCFEGTTVRQTWDALDLDLCESLYTEQQETGTAMAAPFYSYPREAPVVEGDRCITGQSALSGLAFYPGGQFPSAYNDALFFADYARRCIWVMKAGAGRIPDPAQVEPFVVGDVAPVDLELGPGGLYYVDLLDGELRRIEFSGREPVAALRASRTYGELPLRIRFSAAGSRSRGKGRLRLNWDLDGDGRFGDSHRRRPTRVYRRARPITVRVRVTRGRATDTAKLRIFPGNTPPEITLGKPTRKLRWRAGERVRFSGGARDRQDGTLGARAIDWELLLRHCRIDEGCHTHPMQSFPNTRAGSFITPEHEFPAYLRLRATATDRDGLRANRSIRLRPRTARVQLQTDPSGLLVGLNDTYGPGPVSVKVIPGSSFTITAPSPQELDGVTYEWVSWSDGGARSHEAVTQEDVTFGATFEPGL